MATCIIHGPDLEEVREQVDGFLKQINKDEWQEVWKFNPEKNEWHCAIKYGIDAEAPLSEVQQLKFQF